MRHKAFFGVLAITAFLQLFSVSLGLSQTQLIANGGFESGSSSWIMAGGAGIYSDGGYAHSGTYYLWLGGAEGEVDSAYQTISIPSSATSATLSFYYNIDSEEGNSVAYDTFDVTIRTTTGGILDTVGSWSNKNKDPAPGNPYYHLVTFNLLPYAGLTVRIQFSSSNDVSQITNFQVDDVSVQVNATGTPPTNDLCSAAIPMTAGTTYTMNTANASSTGDPSPACQPSFGKGVWYAFTPPVSGAVTISTCGSDFDTVLAVYTGTCGSLTQVGCNDDVGPACSSSQASVSFAGIAGTTYRILVGGISGASGNLSILATSSGVGGLNIVPTFDSSITSDPQSAAIQATINAAIAVYESTYSDPITVTITFQKSASGVGHSSTYYDTASYANYRAALVSHAATADDATALAHLPNSANNPVNGSATMNLHLPLLRALGLPNSDAPPGETDAIISLNTSVMNLTSANPDPNKYSLFATAAHEVDEVLGMASALNGLNNGDPAPSGAIDPQDLFRYDSSGARSWTTAANAASYFSIDGTTTLARYNQQAGGDFQDWYSYFGGQISQVQDAYGTRGSFPVLGVELRVLDVLGFTRVASGSPSLAYSRVGNNLLVSWPAQFTGFNLQTSSNMAVNATWANVQTAPTLLNGQYYVTNAISGAGKFFRLIK